MSTHVKIVVGRMYNLGVHYGSWQNRDVLFLWRKSSEIKFESLRVTDAEDEKVSSYLQEHFHDP